MSFSKYGIQIPTRYNLQFDRCSVKGFYRHPYPGGDAPVSIAYGHIYFISINVTVILGRQCTTHSRLPHLALVLGDMEYTCRTLQSSPLIPFVTVDPSFPPPGSF